jgi:hypothetical protein
MKEEQKREDEERAKKMQERRIKNVRKQVDKRRFELGVAPKVFYPEKHPDVIIKDMLETRALALPTT